MLKSKLVNMKKCVRTLNNGTDVLDQILEIGEKKAIEFNYNSMNKKFKILTKKFVAPERKLSF